MKMTDEHSTRPIQILMSSGLLVFQVAHCRTRTWT